MVGNNKQLLVEFREGIRLVITDHGLDYGSRFTAEVYAADGKCCGSLGSADYAARGRFIDDAVSPQARVEHFAAAYDLCILKALSAGPWK
ncbi:MAG: hypothetical protein WB919_16575 [Candidatus Sulfotelmatobacter sp.]